MAKSARRGWKAAPTENDVQPLKQGGTTWQNRRGLSQIPGKGAFYVIAFTDGDGVPLTGGTNYKLNMPKDVPAANFWSVTLYEAENASGLANGQPFPSLGSRDKPVQNADGSTDLYLGPKAPEGKEKNWLATVPGKGYFAILRIYGPTEPALTKSWKPGDVAKMK